MSRKTRRSERVMKRRARNKERFNKLTEKRKQALAREARQRDANNLR